MVKYTKEKFQEIKNNMAKIVNRIPENLAGWVWNHYKSISGSNENQPCGCQSAAGLWRNAVITIQDFIKNYEQTD